MFRTVATGFYPRFLQRRLGAEPIGAVDAALITTGVALAVRGEKPLLAAALLFLGSYRAWEATRSRPSHDSDFCNATINGATILSAA